MRKNLGETAIHNMRRHSFLGKGLRIYLLDSFSLVFGLLLRVVLWHPLFYQCIII